MKRASVFGILVAMLALGAGCSSDESSETSTANGSGPAGGPVTGAADTHCQAEPTVEVDPAACATPNTSNDGAGGAADDGSPDASNRAGATARPDCHLAHDLEYGDTMYNTEGDDDDCKYHVRWSSTAVRVNEDVTFTVAATSKSSGDPLEGLTPGTNALSRLELYIPCEPTHAPPSSDFKASVHEVDRGTYTVGPIRFDESGRWVVRFHFYESCLDQDQSPHGHAGFFVDVP